MKLTPEEFAAASAYEHQMQVAVRSKYLRNIGRSGLAVLVPIYERISGSKQRVNANCAECILSFIQRIGAIYFADKAERESTAEGSKPATEEPANEGRRRGRARRSAE